MCNTHVQDACPADHGVHNISHLVKRLDDWRQTAVNTENAVVNDGR